MKIKSRSDDFIVDEYLDLPRFSSTGEYVIYKLEKSGLSTLDVVTQLVRKYKIPDREISFAGMKDRYALTSQYLSIRSNKTREIREKNFTLTPLGRAVRPVGPDLLRKNRFKITLRGLDKILIPKIVSNLYEVSKYGFPNYFGEQRFGSIRHGGEFLAKYLMLEDFEEALKIYLTQWSSKDRSRIKEFKKFISRHWGNWEECLKVSLPPNERIIISYLRDHPRDFVKALNLVNPRMLFLYVAAYQSYLWNKMTSEYLRINFREEELMKFHYAAGEMVFYKTISDELLKEFIQTQIPLLDHKVEFAEEKIKDIAEMIIRREGVSTGSFRLNKIKKAFFKSVPRNLIVFPVELETYDPSPDEIYPNKFKLRVSFFLPSGSYASVLLRRIEIGKQKTEITFG
ncbi:MAG: tRNA pseudouridine(13) synthase TruD [Deltaproteobacteria bacterium]|nr:tRNA pseudouridine(13) synthase TruD [Deltaproteobacteria bacterium]